MSAPAILIAGLGNIFLRDDGFGVEVARRLMRHPFPSDVAVRDFGIRGFDFAYALLEPYEMVIVVDAAQFGGIPGALRVIEPGTLHDVPETAIPETHGMVPTRAIEMAKQLGGDIPPLRFVLCEPESFGEENEGQIGLSAPVSEAVEEALSIVTSLVEEVISTRASATAKENQCTNSA